MHSEVIAHVIEECRDKADAYLRCAEALAKLLPEPEGEPRTPVAPAPRRVRRVLGSQADYQASLLATLTTAEDGLGIAALVDRTGIKRTSVSNALRDLQATQQIHKVGDYRDAVYRLGPRRAPVLA